MLFKIYMLVEQLFLNTAVVHNVVSIAWGAFAPIFNHMVECSLKKFRCAWINSSTRWWFKSLVTVDGLPQFRLSFMLISPLNFFIPLCTLLCQWCHLCTHSVAFCECQTACTPPLSKAEWQLFSSAWNPLVTCNKIEGLLWDIMEEFDSTNT